jgi:streptogramin lyase
MGLVFGWLIVLAAAQPASALPGSAGNAPVGAIREIPIHGKAADIAAGPDGNLWFTQNFPVPDAAIGRITPSGQVTRFSAGLSPGTNPLEIVAGPDGNLWFTYDPGFPSSTGGGVGRVTLAGQITLFPEPPGLHGSPFEIVAGSDGNLWFNHAAILSPTGQAIGRITPSGEITEFFTGLRDSANVGNLTAGPGGIWFADESSRPAIGRIAPSGEITEFPGLRPHPFPIIYGPTAGPEGNLWFAANDQSPPPVERITPTGTIERFSAGIDPRADDLGPFAVGSDGNVWFRVVKHPSRRRPKSDRELTAIGRITPDGRIAEFSDCLRPMPGFSGPNFLTLGPDGNVWFTTWTSDPTYFRRAATPSIGRITPGGAITEFRLGLHPRSYLEELVSAGGRLWFIDRETDSIGTIAPPQEPPNTFFVLSARTPPGKPGARLRVALPGRGRLTVAGAKVRSRSTVAPGCGTAGIEVVPKHQLAQLLTHRGSARVTVHLTYTPRGGSSFGQRVRVTLRSRQSPAHS